MMGRPPRHVQMSRLQVRLIKPVSQETTGQLRRYKCQRLPPYVILHYKRFTKNAFVEEKNPTIVNFPLRGVDFRECESEDAYIS